MFTTTLLTVIFATIPVPSNLQLTGTVTQTLAAPGSWFMLHDAMPRVGDQFFGEAMCYPWGGCLGYATIGTFRQGMAVNSDTEYFALERQQLPGLYPEGTLVLGWPGEPLPPGWSRDPSLLRDVTVQLTGMHLTVHKLGDSNLDGRFNSRDIITAFRAGEYEDGIFRNSTFIEGDWNADQEFDSADFIAVFKALTYEQPAVAVVPEPSAMILLLLGMFSLRRLATAA